MAFETYDLASLRDEVKTEFGLTGTAKDGVVDKAINDSIRWIIRKRNGLWPWQQKNIVFNIQPRKQGTTSVTQGSATATWVSVDKPIAPTPTSNREIIALGSTDTNLRDGYLVSDFVDPIITLDAEYIGATDTVDHVIIPAYYILPENFQRMLILVDTSISSGRIIHRTEEDLEWLRRDKAIAVGLTHRYSVTMDPLPETSSAYGKNRLFMLLYPYSGERKTLRGQYLANHQTLTADTDIPLVPQNNRDVVFRMANFFFSMKLKDSSMIAAYKELADESLKDMLHFYDLAVDDTDDVALEEYDIGPVQGPPNLPSWDLI